MTSIFSYLIVMFAGLFWVIRVVITACYTLGANIGVIPLNSNLEIALLFVTLVCMVFIIKRNIFGALIYMIANVLYFGDDLYQGVIKIINGSVGMTEYISIVLSFFGVLIPILIVFDIFFNKEGKGKTKDKKTDWFYANKQYDREFDERSDRNQYKF